MYTLTRMQWASPLDVGIAAYLRRQRMFTLGWGDEELLSKLDTQTFFDAPPAVLELSVNAERVRSVRYRGHKRELIVQDITFTSPFAALPASVLRAHLRVLKSPGNRALVVILAGSREEGYRLRESIYGSLVFRGIDVALLENPFYGLRRPVEQHGGNVRTVSEHVLLNLAMVEEGRALVEHFAASYEKVAVAGYSMGGFMAGLVGATTPRAIAIAACAAGASPAPTYTKQFLSWSIDYTALGQGARERLERVFSRADLTNYAPPVAANAAVIVGCSRDGYVAPSQVRALHDHWPGSELRWVRTGHVSALFTERRALRKAIRDALDRLGGH